MYKEFKKYLVSLDDSDIQVLRNRIKENGVEAVIQYQLRFLDCSRCITNQNGESIRAIQTIDYTYKDELTKLLYVIDKYYEDKVELYAKVLELHNKNLEFEKFNPPITYKSKRKTSRSKTTRNPVERKSQKKLKEELKVKKLSLLTFKLKPK